MKRPKLIKVRIHDRNDNVESIWAIDRGPAKGRRGARLVEINNISFMHTKPTYGDTIVVEPDPEDASWSLQWDRRGVAESKIGTRIHADGGRYAMIVDYRPPKRGVDRWKAMCAAVRKHGVIPEGAWAPSNKRPGRAYFAVGGTIKPAEVVVWLADAATGYEITQIHPRPRKPRRRR